MKSELEIREEICAVGRSLFERGYVHATAGNISVRLEDGFLITPTDACLGRLDPERLAKVDGNGIQLSGERASKTLRLHRRIYESDPAANCVIHTHSTHLVALTLCGVWRDDAILPPITPYFVMKVGKVPLIPYAPPGAEEVAERVALTIKQQKIRAVMLDRLGPVVWSQTPGMASAIIEELEETAKLWHMSDGKVTALDNAQIEALYAIFGANW
jgi:3-dehydro-4-phosphotetronate decarboxylase